MKWTSKWEDLTRQFKRLLSEAIFTLCKGVKFTRRPDKIPADAKCKKKGSFSAQINRSKA